MLRIKCMRTGCTGRAYGNLLLIVHRYSMLLADTILVSESGEQEILTGTVSKRFGDVSYFIEVPTSLLLPIFLRSPLNLDTRSKLMRKSLSRSLP